jgi:ATP-binding cassette subfamily C protein CydD
MVLILAPEIYFPLRNVAALFHASADGAAAVKEISTIRKDGEIAQTSLIEIGANFISWKDLNFEISEHIQAQLPSSHLRMGHALFIIGESGAGKSTFAVRIINELLQSAHKNSIGYVPQIPHLAPGNIREQFLLLRRDASDSEIISSLREVGLHMADLEDGLKTLIGGAGENSNQLSGGQIRKIAVARALFKNPSFIIADEPTADLDADSANLVMNALRKRSAQGTLSIFITHDLSQVNSGDVTLRMKRVDR